MSPERLLSHYRALDLTDEKGMLCGKILADLGMDVIKVEPPGGDPARNIGPHFYETPAFRFSKTPLSLERPAPCLGEHNQYICTEILGLKEEEFHTLEKAGVFR